MSDPKIKSQMIKENKGINWEPTHIRDGRFGEWLKDIKDWAISRERYWGTPLPVWVCESCKKIDVIGSIEEIKEKTKKSGNKYFVMRHGQAENNVDNSTYYKDINYSAELTEKGREQILKSSKNLKEKIDIVISSPLERAKETSKIICGFIGFPMEKVIYDKRVQEWETSSFFEGKSRAIYDKYYDEDYLDKPNEILPNSESFSDVIRRVGQFIYELETKYSDKNILIIGHAGASNALSFATKGLLLDSLSSKNNPFIPLKNAEIRKFDFIPLPHNENYELDLHRPYIDEINLVCTHSTSSGQACGGNLIHAKEVMDVWFDSGSMPFAQDHYPFENKKWVDGKGYPADFISEAIDQTRGWFYTLHAVGVLMGRGKAFKNVICLGHLLDASGKKMSKSLGNIVDPWIMMEKYGVDTLRFWMYGVNQAGESKNFDEKTVLELNRQVFGLLYNVLAFYELYRDKNLEKNDQSRSNNILDKWILAKLDELIELSTKNLDNYKLLEPTRAIRDFIGDLSTWYLRRSRDRIKKEAANPEVEQVHYGARATLYFVLKTLAKIITPFAPFTAEDIWLKLRIEKDEESVHLAKWPAKAFKLFSFGKSKILEDMEIARQVVTTALDTRQKMGLKVRQPLSFMSIPYNLSQEFLDIVADEVNIKEVKFIDSSKLYLNPDITPELKQEGSYREFVRAIQDMRKKMGLTPSDVISLVIETNDEGKKLIQKFESELLKTILASKIEFKQSDGETLKIDELVFKVKIAKI